MENILAKANYFLALEKNSMTDEIRNEYIAHIEKYPNYFIVLSALLKTVIRQFKEEKISKEEAIDLFKNEFIKLKLNETMCSLDELLPLINLLFREKPETYSISIELLKEYINAADQISIDSLVYCVYYAVLDALLRDELISVDIDFSEKVINFVKEHKTVSEDDTIFLNIFLGAIFYSK